SSMAPASTRACLLTLLAAVPVPQAPSGVGSVSRRAALGRLVSMARQSLAFAFTLSGTLMMRAHSGHRGCLPSRPAPTRTWLSHQGQVNSIMGPPGTTGVVGGGLAACGLAGAGAGALAALAAGLG